MRRAIKTDPSRRPLLLHRPLPLDTRALRHAFPAPETRFPKRRLPHPSVGGAAAGLAADRAKADWRTGDAAHVSSRAMHPDEPELHSLHATAGGAISAQGASTCGGGTPSTGVATAEPSAPAAAMRSRFVSNDAETRQPEAGIEGDDPGQDAPGDDADGQACSTASAMAEPSAVVAEARARIDDRMRELSPACPYRAEIARWLRDQWPPGAEVVPPLPRHAAEIAKKAGSNATSIHDSVKGSRVL